MEKIVHSGRKGSMRQGGGRRARLGLNHTVCEPLSGLGISSQGQQEPLKGFKQGQWGPLELLCCQGTWMFLGVG